MNSPISAMEARHDEWRKAEAEAEARCAHKKAEDHHTRCRGCGAFVSKRRWVLKDRFNAIQHQQRPLCSKCFEEYD